MVAFEEEEPEKPEGTVAFLPTLTEWQKYYGASCEGNDQKAVRLYREYESKEKLRRLQYELMQIKEEKVRENVLDDIVGKKRATKYGGYSGWAKLMLLWIVSK